VFGEPFGFAFVKFSTICVTEFVGDSDIKNLIERDLECSKQFRSRLCIRFKQGLTQEGLVLLQHSEGRTLWIEVKP
jgi:hypothetical protein